MKKFLGMVLAFFCIILLTGCTTTGVKTTVDGWVNTLVQKDQEKQQGFVLTKELLYDEYDQDNQEIMLSDIGLVAIPDFCTLLNPADQSKLKNISLANNDIKYAAQDLSCLTGLERLNLAYNNIETIGNLGELPALRELLLQKNEIAAIQSFPNLPSLETLNLSYNKLKELSNLGNLKNLLTLEVAHNQLEKVIGIEKLEKLQQLKVEFNKLQEIDSIDDLLELEVVTAKGNELKSGFIDKLEEINKDYIEANFGSVGGNIGNVLIDEVEKSLDSSINTKE